MGKTISQEIINKIPELYCQLKSIKKVSEELGISTSTVRKYLEISKAITPKKKTKITPEIIESINAKFSEYKNMSKVAKELGIASTTVKKYLNEENLKLIKSSNDDRDALFFYIYRLFGQYSEEEPVSSWNIIQMQRFKEKGMSYKGQLLTLKYFYDIKHNSTEKSKGSIGIIPYVWSDAELYYQNQVKKAEEISKAIKEQLEQDRLEIKINPSQYLSNQKKRNKKLIDIDSIGDD